MEPGDWQPRHVMIGTDLCIYLDVEYGGEYDKINNNSNMHITRG